MKKIVAGLLIICTTISFSVQAQTNRQWTYTGEMQTGRAYHTATLLPNGKVLIAGGGSEEAINSAEVFDPATKAFTPTEPLKQARRTHRATLLPNGKVLVTGGFMFESTPTQSAELYDPATGTWATTGALNVARALHTATLLADGHVLVTGGFGGPNIQAVQSAELYDVETGKWTLNTQPLKVARWLHQAALLFDGKVLLVAGFDTNHSTRAEIYDPATNSFSLTKDLNFARANFTANLLPNGTVLAVGGASPASYTAEVFSPLRDLWVVSSPPLDGRYNQSAVALGNGKILVTGGTANVALNTAELYDPDARLPEPAVQRWSNAGNLNTGRFWHTSTLLKNGRVLVAGGTQNGQPIPFLKSAELFDPFLQGAADFVAVSASHFEVTPVAPASIVTAFGTQLATTTQLATSQPLPTQLGGTQVRLQDGAGNSQLAPLFFVSPKQVNYLIPADLIPGIVSVTISNENAPTQSSSFALLPTAPGLFSANANGFGPAAATLLRVKTDGSRTFEPVARYNTSQNTFVTFPIEFGPPDEQLFLMLFATGVRGRSNLSSVIVYVGGLRSEVLAAQAQGGFAGLDQINIRLPRALAGRGEVEVFLTVHGQIANAVKLNFK